MAYLSRKVLLTCTHTEAEYLINEMPNKRKIKENPKFNLFVTS